MFFMLGQKRSPLLCSSPSPAHMGYLAMFCAGVGIIHVLMRWAGKGNIGRHPGPVHAAIHIIRRLAAQQLLCCRPVCVRATLMSARSNASREQYKLALLLLHTHVFKDALHQQVHKNPSVNRKISGCLHIYHHFANKPRNCAASPSTCTLA